MMALYAACSRAKNAASTASTTGGAVQSRVLGVPACACASRVNPYAKLTSTASPPGEAQFAATVKGAGANAPLAATLNHVEPREKCGNTTLLLKCPNPTAMSSAPCAPVASMESSTSEYCTRNAAVS